MSEREPFPHFFDVIGLQAADLPNPGLAAAFARSGGLGLLDLEFVRDASLAAANFAQLCAAGGARIGLRITPGTARLAKKLIDGAGERPLTVVLAGTGHHKKLRKDAGLRAGDRVWAELSDPAQLDAAAACDGIVARGHEAGGWVGEYTSYILLQKLAGKLALPLYVLGGVGLHSAAAVRAAGAAGVVFDDQLLLLAESPLPVAVQTELGRLNGSETRLLGELLDHGCRVYARPGSPLLKTADDELRRAEGGELAVEDWRKATAARVGWSFDGSTMLPLGQGIGLAQAFRRRYGNVAAFIQAVRRDSLRQIRQAGELRALDENSALAVSHGTRFPLAQGPMTRVSDSPAFAVEVARGGALPFLALALMRGPQVREMLEQTAAAIGGLPWGVGLLGFIPHALREEQCEAIWQCKPPFALIAGGRPDQAAEFEKRGIRTYIHAPAPALLKMYLEQGAKRFVFEGRECGGHIGPLASFTLWEEMIDVLLEHVKPGEAKDIHVLFAGGVHDARSGAMVAAMTAPLAARGMKVGALMGTAYLFTQEIVASGAVVAGFQEQALACERTRNLETGPGHSTRCADTQFAHDFFEQRRRLIREGRSAEEIRDVLEDLNLGRLRIAAKGVNRDESGAVVEIDADRQLTDGMYMIGQVATLRAAPITIEALHADVCRGGQAQLEALLPEAPKPEAEPADVAIVGIGIVLPKANSANDYWHNLLHKVSVIREVPETRWDWKLFFDENRQTRDKVYSKWGGFLDEIAFDPTRFGIPPRSMKSIDPMQLLALEAASRALDDAGYANGGFDRNTTSVVLGSSGGAGELGLQYGLRAELPRYVADFDSDVWERLPEWTEESFAGVLPNVAAGRIANRLDFGGINMTVDAACASSLAAINIAVEELASGRSSMVLAGGFDTTQSVYGFTTFAKTQALSPSGKARTFDETADGIAISEGVAILVLKRLADAEAAGDRIYAVIKATAGSSDGKALGLTAPRSEGQMRALERAYAKAGFRPSTLGLVEAHGTGTAVGDRAEALTITRALAAEHAAPKSVALGSVKTLLGHTKAAAGVSGVAKVALSLYHRTLPAHVGVSKPIAPIADPASAVYLLKEPRPWVASPDHPRRGASSAFGFGGTNFHAVLEEYAGPGGGGAAGAEHWPYELCVFRAADGAALMRELEALLPKLAAGNRIVLGELALLLARNAESRGNLPASAAIVCASTAALAADLQTLLTHLRGDARPLPAHIRLNLATPATTPALAFVFPGQGAQYVNMGREAALYCDEVRAALELADRCLRDVLPQPLSSYVLPPSAFDDATEAAQARALTDTRVAQPALGALALGYLNLARRLGLSAGAAAGHSYGEYAALMAAGVLSPVDFLKLSSVRGQAMADASNGPVAGAMAAVQARREQVLPLLAGCEGVIVANHNAPEQCVISGPKAGVEQAVQTLAAAQLRAVMLPVSGAFHTELVAPAQPPLSAALAAASFMPPQFPVWSNGSARPYPAGSEAMRRQLDSHLLGSVEFVAEIEAMYAAGTRVFVELGPKSICSNMIRQTLAGRDDALAISLDANGGGLRGLLSGLAELFVAGARWQPSALFFNRALALLDAAQLDALSTPVVLARHTWMLSGGCARPIDDPLLRAGSLPPLTAASAAAQREAHRRQIAASAPAAANAAPVAPPAAVPTASPASPALTTEAVLAYQQTMRQFLALQERVVRQFLGGGAGDAPAAAGLPAMPAALPITAPPLVPVVPAAPVVPMTPAAATLAPAVSVSVPAAAPAPAVAFDVRQTLLDIVADRTGYPPDMLALDADLEADLGIDSIKRVEILGALQKALPAGAAAQMQSQMERFTKARTLDAILGEARALAGLAAPQIEIVAITPAPTAQAAAATVAATVAATAFDARRALIDIVAERTGYPPDMLTLDADLEADLGIDSIKRVEILGGLQKLLSAPLAEAMQSQMERFTKARSLQAILDAFATIDAGGTAAAVIAPAAVTIAPVTIAPVTIAPVTIAVAAPQAAFDAKAALLNIVAERTGYPPELLSDDADLEADLGIDSIKRVEILGAFQKLLPAATAAAMQSTMERFTKARSLSAILAAYAELSSAPAAPAVNLAPAAPVAATAATIPRYLIKSQPMPLPAARADLKGLTLVFGGTPEVIEQLRTALPARGLTPVFIDTTEPEALQAAINEAQSRHGSAGAVLHLHGLLGEDAATPAQWQALGSRCVLSLFHVAKALEPQLAGTHLHLIAATRLGGTFGRDAFGSGAPIAGGVTGLSNCLRHEYPDAQIRTVDFDGQSDAEIATELVAELLADDPQPEAGWIGGERYGSVTVEQAAAEHAFAPNLKPEAGWVLLVTGGARGITAEILEELAVPGLRYVLLGRTAEPGAEAAGTAALAGAAELRKALLDAAIARGEKPKPVEIDRAVAALLVDREIRRNLARLRARGATVEYLACDVRDADAFAAAIDGIYARHGRIDAVIHAAGVIEDKLLKDKTAESFARVFGTKLDPAFVLLQKLRPEGLKWLSFFTSVAGRYGNRGQSDYAAANEALNRIAWSTSRDWPQTRVFAVNWGPWDAGMASEAVRRAFREKGMEPIPVAAGRRFFADELAYGTRQDVEIVAGEGPWRHLGPASVAPAAASATGDSAYPLIRDALRMGPGGNMTLDHVFTLESDPYLIDHCMDGKAVVPAAGALEYMAQFVGAAWPGWHVVGMRDLRQLNGIVLEGGKRAVQLRARASSHSDLHGQTVTVEIIDPQRKLPFYRATAILLQTVPEAPPAQAPILPGEGIAIEAAQAYGEHLFHGPRFRLIERIDKLHGGGISASVKPSQVAAFIGGGGRWVFDPGLMDLPPQLAFVWARVQQDKGALPAGFGSVSRYGSEPLSGPLKLVMRLKPPPHEHAIAYDADIIDAQGRVRIAIVDGTSTMSAGLNKLAPNHVDFVAGLQA